MRVHTDGAAALSARDVSARAYTLGSDVAFGSGQYEPGSDAGRRLLAHELTHVVQQGGAAPGQIRRDPDPAVEAARVEKIKADYDAAIKAQNMASAAVILNGFSPDDIQLRLGKLSPLERRGIYFAAPKWATNVLDPIAKMDPKVKEGAAVSDAQLDQIQKANPGGVTVALYAAYDYGGDETRKNNAAFPLEATRFAGNEGAVGLSGGSVSCRRAHLHRARRGRGDDGAEHPQGPSGQVASVADAAAGGGRRAAGLHANPQPGPVRARHVLRHRHG